MLTGTFILELTVILHGDGGSYFVGTGSNSDIVFVSEIDGEELIEDKTAFELAALVDKLGHAGDIEGKDSAIDFAYLLFIPLPIPFVLSESCFYCLKNWFVVNKTGFDVNTNLLPSFIPDAIYQAFTLIDWGCFNASVGYNMYSFKTAFNPARKVYS